MLREEERDAAVLRTERAATHPHDLPRSEQRVEVARVVSLDARREDARLEVRRRDERALELGDRVEQRGLSLRRRVDAVPRDREASERVLLDRLDLAPQPRERAAA